MTSTPVSHQLVPAASFTAADTVSLGYDARILRRKRLVSEGGIAFLVSLAEVTGLQGGEGFVLDDGRVIEVVPATEDVLVIRGDLPKLAWHIGNRHTPCQIESDRLTIRPDHVLEAMLAQLGADVTRTTAPFTPEGGAYGLGRTMGHSHGDEAHSADYHGANDHGHSHEHDHSHAHSHVHSHSHAHSHGHSHDHDLSGHTHAHAVKDPSHG
ncbi:urease accessory protein UreE [Albirhodobacter sp. R86504]|uniref:urease accessory protein UreE n=1 Tax=Albirhodobacter sp. R86504 TaxID=3093848 RepID=UPI00366FB20E